MAWTENDWQILLTKIRSGQVIPIIGKDLINVRIEVPQNECQSKGTVSDSAEKEEQVQEALPQNAQYGLKPLYDWLCSELIRANPALNLNLDNFYHLESLSAKIIRSSDMTIDNLKLEITQLIEGTPHKDFTNLRKLAEITDFKLFINTTFTPYLSTELREFYNQQRQDELAVYEVNYSPNSAFRNLKTIRLKDPNVASIKNLTSRCVLNLFGDYDDNDFTTFLLTDSEIVDLMVYLLISNEWKESALFDLIKSSNSHFLFIGCSFPEWLFKFFVRVFSKEWSDFDNTQSQQVFSRLSDRS